MLSSYINSGTRRTDTYTYDAVGNVLTKTDYQGAVTHYCYDSANRLVSMQNPDYVEVSYQYDPAGRLLTRILSNGTQTRYGYDDNNRLESLTTEHANGSVVGEETYTRDRMGNILTTTTSTGTTSDVYDPMYRLKRANAPGTAHDVTYGYDLVGNRKTHVTASGTLAYVHNEGNRLTEIRQGSASGTVLKRFTYDDEGNVTEQRTGGGSLLQRYVTDAKGRMTQMTSSGKTFSYLYDPMDYRIHKQGPGVSAGYLLEGEHVETVTGSHQPAQFFRGVVIDEIVNGYQYDPQGEWTNYTYAHDSLQSVVGLTGHEGRTIQTTTYGPFGNEIGGAGASCSVLRYTGREKDAETGLYYYRARYYDPELGRFISEDPLGFGAGDANFYAYVGNNPVNANDPSGHVAVGGALTNVVLGGAIRFLSGESVFDTGAIIQDAVFGAVGAGILSKVAKLSQVGGIATNKLAGKVAEQQVAKVLVAEGNTILGSQVSVNTSLGRRVIDHLIQTPNTNLLAIEVKAGGGVRNAAQLAKDSALATDGGILVGKNAPRRLRGTNRIIPTVERGVADPIGDRNAPLLKIGGGVLGQFGSQAFNGASGGFLIYPNKPNLNFLQQVYSK